MGPGRPFLELRERTEEAGRDADVRRLQPHVAIEVRAVPVPFLTDLVGQLPHRDPIGMTEEPHAVFERKPFAGRHLVANRLKLARGHVASTNTAEKPARSTLPKSS